MAIPTKNEALAFVDASMDPDGLRVLIHLAEERRSMIRAGRVVHERPAVVEAQAFAQPSPRGPAANAREAAATETKAAETGQPNARQPMKP